MASSARLNGAQKQADHLLATQKVLRATLGSSMDMIQVFEAVRNQQGEIIDFTWLLDSQAAETISGNVIDQRWLEKQPGVMEEGLFAAFKHVVETGRPQQYEKQYVHESFDGWFQLSVVKLNDGVVTTTTDITSRKKVEQQLQQSQTLLQSVIDSSLDVIQVFKAVRNQNGSIVDFVWVMNNQKAVDQNGEVIGKRLLTRSPGVVPTGIFDRMVEVVQTGIASEHEQFYNHEQFDGWFYQALVKTEDGVAMTTRDITQAKRAEDQILRLKDEIAQQATDKYYTLFSSIDEGFLILQLIRDETGRATDLRLLEVNQAFTRQTGLGADTVGKLASELLPTLEWFWLDTYDRVARSGTPERVEHYNQATARWYNVHMSRVGRQDDQVAVLLEDVTSRKQAEQQQAFLLALSDALRAEADESSIKVQTVNMLAQHLGLDRCWISEVFEREGISTVGPEYLVPKLSPMAGVFRLADYPETMQQLLTQPMLIEDVPSNPNFSASEKALLTGFGLGALLVVPLRKRHQVIWALAGTMTTPRRWTERERGLLEDVAERTWAAVERVKAEEVLRQEDRRKDEFMAMLGHELRNPLGSLSNTLLLLQLTQGTDASLPYSKAVELMSREVSHMSRMIDDLLDIGRIRYGLIHLHKTPLNLVTLVRQTVEVARPAYQEHQRHLTFSSPVTSLMVLGDETRLAQVVMNLLTNGLKYTPAGGSVWVNLERVSDWGGDPQALLAVKDNGIGIAKDQQQAIFDIFVQGETTLDRPQGGLGLGLAVVKHLVGLHEGQVEVLSEGEGRGSEFLIRLPLTTQAITEPEIKRFRVSSAKSKGRVLVVDDNQVLADSTARLLELSGYTSRASYSGASALKEAQQWRPEVILLDLGMPYMDGFEVNHRLKEQPWGESIAVIALTGYGQQTHQPRVKEAGFSGYLLKPLQLAQLRELLTKVIGR